MSGTRAGVGRIVAIGIALALALLLLVAKEATAGKYSVAQCGWYAGRARPLRRGPPEEFHSRWPGDGVRYALRPLALGRSGGNRDLSSAGNLVAHTARRHRAAARHGQLGRRL